MYGSGDYDGKRDNDDLDWRLTRVCEIQETVHDEIYQMMKM